MVWPTATLEEISLKPQYGAIAKGRTEPVGPLFVRQTDIAGGRIDWSSVPYCDLEPTEFKKFAVHPGDLLISRLGNGVGNAATVRESNGAVFAGYLVRFQPSRDLAVPEFVGYQLQSEAWRRHVTGFRSGAAQPTLNARQMGDFSFFLPPIPAQRSITATLGALDDKIESNRRTTELAEALGDSLFTSVAGSAASLTTVAQLIMGSSPPGSSYNEDGIGMPFFQGVRDFGSRFPSRRVWTTAPVRLASPNDTLISVRAPVGRLNRSWETCCVGRGVAAVHSDFPSTIYYALRAASDLWAPFQQEGTVFGAINRTDLATSRLPWPSTANLSQIESQLSLLDERIASLSRETGHLVDLREILLPELLSGRIRVPEAVEVMQDEIDESEGA